MEDLSKEMDDRDGWWRRVKDLLILSATWWYIHMERQVDTEKEERKKKERKKERDSCRNREKLWWEDLLCSFLSLCLPWKSAFKICRWLVFGTPIQYHIKKWIFLEELANSIYNISSKVLMGNHAFNRHLKKKSSFVLT